MWLDFAFSLFRAFAIQNPYGSEHVTMNEQIAERSRLPDTAVCLQCGYSLRMLPDNRCPECGRAFDPARPNTWRDPADVRLLDRIFAFWSRPPGWIEVGIVGVPALLLFILCPVAWSRGDGAFRDYSVMAIMVVAPLFLWRALLRLRLATLPLRWRPGKTGRWRKLRWLLVPVCVATILTANSEPRTIFALRWAVSRPLMERRAASVLRNGTVVQGPTLSGLVLCGRIAPLADGRVKFESGGAALIYDPAARNLSPMARPMPDPHWSYWRD